MKHQKEVAPNWKDLSEPYSETVAVLRATNDLVSLAIGSLRSSKDKTPEELEEMTNHVQQASAKMKVIITALQEVKPHTEKDKQVGKDDYQEYYNESIKLANLASDLQAISEDHLSKIIE